MLQVLDDSMEPEFARGCVITIDPTGRPESGAYVLAERPEQFVFRQLRLVGGEVFLEALNKSYPRLRCAEGLAVVKGVVVQRSGPRRSYHKRYDSENPPRD